MITDPAQNSAPRKDEDVKGSCLPSTNNYPTESAGNFRAGRTPEVTENGVQIRK